MPSRNAATLVALGSSGPTLTKPMRLTLDRGCACAPGDRAGTLAADARAASARRIARRSDASRSRSTAAAASVSRASMSSTRATRKRPSACSCSHDLPCVGARRQRSGDRRRGMSTSMPRRPSRARADRRIRSRRCAARARASRDPRVRAGSAPARRRSGRSPWSARVGTRPHRRSPRSAGRSARGSRRRR